MLAKVDIQNLMIIFLNMIKRIKLKDLLRSMHGRPNVMLVHLIYFVLKTDGRDYCD
jgi:hypothetical protein